MNTPSKTNAARQLDKAGIVYELLIYPVDENDLSATHLAQTIGVDIETVFKTIVLKGDRNGHLVCVVPGNMEVDLKAAAKASGNKKVEPIPMKSLLEVTGYIRGGCSPIGMKKKFPTFFHSSITDKETVHVSAGQRGIQIKIKPYDLITFTSGIVADIAQENE